MRSRRGAALLLVIVIIGLLTLVVSEFQRKSYLESLSAANNTYLLQAHALARSGVAAAVALLNEDAQSGQTDDRTESWYFGQGPEAAQAIPVGEYIVSMRIEDQYGKFPVNAMVDATGKDIPTRIDGFKRMLDAMELPEVDTQALTWALVDWIDDDNSLGDRYEFNRRFTVPNAPIRHLDEISRLEVYCDLKPEILHRILAQLDTRSDAAVNVNTASVPALMAISSAMPLEDAQLLYEKLSTTPDTGNGAVVNTLMPIGGRDFPIQFKSSRFRVVSRGDASGVVREADCVVERKAGSGVGQTGYRAVDWMQY